MKLTIELTDTQLSRLKESLKISYADYKRAHTYDPPGQPPSAKQPPPEFGYVFQILRAREALNLSTSPLECVSDVEKVPLTLE